MGFHYALYESAENAVVEVRSHWRNDYQN